MRLERKKRRGMFTFKRCITLNRVTRISKAEIRGVHSSFDLGVSWAARTPISERRLQPTAPQGG